MTEYAYSRKELRISSETSMSTMRPSPAGEALAVRRATWCPSLTEPSLSWLDPVQPCSDTHAHEAALGPAARGVRLP